MNSFFLNLHLLIEFVSKQALLFKIRKKKPLKMKKKGAKGFLRIKHGVFNKSVF